MSAQPCGRTNSASIRGTPVGGSVRTGFPVRSPGRAAKLYGILFTDNLGKSCEPAAAQVGPGADRQRCCSRARAPGRSPQGAPRSSIWLTCKQGVAEGQLRAPPCALPGLAVLTSLMASDELMRPPPPATRSSHYAGGCTVAAVLDWNSTVLAPQAVSVPSGQVASDNDGLALTLESTGCAGVPEIGCQAARVQRAELHTQLC